MSISYRNKRTSRLEKEARQAKDELLLTLFGASARAAPGLNGVLGVIPRGHSIVGVGYGTKVTSGATVHGQIAIRVYVRAKAPRQSLSPKDLVPSEVNGVSTDVIAVGDIHALQQPRPVSCGVSVGHVDITAGTLGCLVVDRAQPGGNRFILSNNHVLANVNQANIGDPIIQPGPMDGGVDPGDIIATLANFEVIDFNQPNVIDAAIAQLVNNADVIPEILNIGNVVNPPVQASQHQSVRKHGRTTLHTVGMITDLHADISVQYATQQTAQFTGQLAIQGLGGGAFSQAGDSGSLIVDAVSLRPIGLLFAGGGSVTFANPIGAVLDLFNVDIV